MDIKVFLKLGDICHTDKIDTELPAQFATLAVIHIATALVILLLANLRKELGGSFDGVVLFGCNKCCHHLTTNNFFGFLGN